MMRKSHASIIAATAVIYMMSARYLPAADYPNLPPPKLQERPAAQPSVAPGSTSGALPVPGSTVKPAAPQRPLPVVTISARVGNPTVPLNETVNFIVTLTWEESAGDPGLPLDFEFPEPPQAEGMALFANSFKSETELSGNKVIIKRAYTYEFHARQMVSTEIKPVRIQYFRIGSEEKKELSTQAIPLTVTKARIKPGQALKSPAVRIALVAIIIASLAFFARTWLRARKKEEELAPVRSRHDTARDRLKEADRMRMAGDYGEFMKTVSAELRAYVQDTMKIKAKGLAAEALAEAIAKELGEHWRERIVEFEKLCGEVKFAGYEPKSAEMDGAMKTMKRLVYEVERTTGAAMESEEGI
jgi:hypothetical protein